MTDPSPDQWKAATDHVLQILFLACSRPGLIRPQDISDWLATGSIECDRQGDYGASQLLLEWAEEMQAAADKAKESE